MNLNEEKTKLVDAYTQVLVEIESYWLNDLAISNGPLKEMVARRDRLKRRIEELNKLLNVNDCIC